jgi:hypothetical protein
LDTNAAAGPQTIPEIVKERIAAKLLRQEPHATNYYGNLEAGKFLDAIMRPGASRDWREVLREKIGEDLSALHAEILRAGHGVFAEAEEFLAKHLGGRAEPAQKVEGPSAEVR